MTAAAPVREKTVAPHSSSPERPTPPRRKISVNEGLKWLAAVNACRDLSPIARALASLIRERYSRSEGYARFGYEHAAKCLPYSVNSFHRARAELQRAGFIQCHRGDRRHSNEYVLTFEHVPGVKEARDGDL